MSAPARHPLPLDRWGPDRCDSAVAMDERAARAWCRELAGSHYENFPVLTALVPEDRRDDFAAVYAFCRWADDLGDESGTPERATELLGWWRRELEACVASAERIGGTDQPAAAGDPVRHPVFVALRPTIARHRLPAQPFHDLISAFELDQRVARYDTWDRVIGYCRLSADPVGRLVLMLLGEPRSDELFRLSDSICTALQLTNHWQDIRRDRVERNRVYVPRELNPIADFERRLQITVEQGFGCDHAFLEETRRVVRGLVERTWPLFDEGRALLDRLSPTSRPIIELFVEGGERVLASIEAWNCETVLHRPKLGKPVKLWLVARAWCKAKTARRRSAPSVSIDQAGTAATTPTPRWSGDARGVSTRAQSPAQPASATRPGGGR